MVEQSPLRRFRTFAAADSDVAEQVIERVAAELVKAGDTVVDGGAFMGRHVGHLSGLAKHGLVVAFEANPAFASRLADQFRARPHVLVRDVALGDAACAGRGRFHVDPEHASRSALLSSQSTGTLSEATIDVTVVDLDTELERLGVDFAAVSFVKLDIEGGEYAALRGSARLLSNTSPVVVLEHGADAPAENGYEVRDLDQLAVEAERCWISFDGRVLPGIDTDFWYFFLVADDRASAVASIVSDAFEAVLAELESPSPAVRFRVSARRLVRSVVKRAAPFVPDRIKAALRRSSVLLSR